MLDRPLLQVTAPKGDVQPDQIPSDERELFDWFTKPELVIPRLECQVEDTYWGGDAFPIVFPVSLNLPAIEAAYLGCPYRVAPGSNTGWAEPIIDDWDNRPSLAVDPDNTWWRLTQHLLEMEAQRGVGRHYVGIPDLQGGGEILAMLRGTERLALDLFDHPERVKRAVEEVNTAWLHYYNACFEIIHHWMEGYVDWLAVWSESPAVTVECDMAAMISPAMFQEFFLPALEQQLEWIGRTIFHLDGPGSLPHLDTLLLLPALNGIQWVPGAGAPPISDWIPLLQQIQAAGKLLVLNCEKWEVNKLLAELKPEGVLLNTSCSTVAEADALVEEVGRMFGAAR
jgi:5-methyltetrahydrofolate--homocysteine methyltransferase